MQNSIPDIVMQGIHWGHLSLRGQRKEEELITLWKRLTEIITSGKHEAEAEIIRGSEIVLSQARQALDCLKSEATLYLTESDGEINGVLPGEIQEQTDHCLAVVVAMRNLDQLLYLSHALKGLEQEKLVKSCKEIADNISSLLDVIIGEEDLPFHRLIPLNNLRRSMLENVPTEQRYLFPWYERWSEKRADTIANMAYFIAGEYEGESLFDPALGEAIIDDEPFYNRLMREASLIEVLPEILAEDHVFHLLRETERIFAEASLPEEIVSAGRVDAAIRVAVDDNLAGVDCRKWRVEAALYGMGLSEEEREDILEPYFENGREEMDNQKLQQCLLYMTTRLQEATAKGFIRLPDCHWFFLKLLTCDRPKLLASMIRAWDLAGGWTKAAAKGFSLIFGMPLKLTEKFADHVFVGDVPPTLEVQFAVGRERNEPGEERQARFPVENFPPDPLLMPTVVSEKRRGRKRFFIKILGDNEQRDLRDQLRGFQNLHWGGFAFYDGEFNQLGPNTGFPYSIELENDEGYDLLILYFHPDGELLKKALGGDPEAENHVGKLTYLKNPGVAR